MVIPVRQRFSFAEYLELEEASPIKHEFLDGHVWAMAGGSPDHGAVAANIIGLLAAQLRGHPCRVFTSDVRVRVKATGLATYPDVSVVCGSQETEKEDPKGNTLTNPRLVVEILSPSTEDYDRGEKLAHYKRIDALDHIVLVAHEERRIEIWRREGDHWRLDVARGDGMADLTALGCELPLQDVYRNPLGE